MCLIPQHATLDADARKRLEALQRHTGAGSGFQLSMQDLGIRGAGNLLGTDQSGHIAAIGFTLYCQLLRQTVARMKGEPPPLIVSSEVIMDMLDTSPAMSDSANNACIPYSYIEEDAQRIATYRFLAECVTVDEVEALGARLKDRYGTLPQSVRRLLDVAKLRIRASRLGIQRVDVEAGVVHLWRDGIPIRLSNRELPRVPISGVDTQIGELNRLMALVTPATIAKGK